MWSNSLRNFANQITQTLNLKYIAIWLLVHCLQRIHLVIFAHTVHIVTIKHNKLPNTKLKYIMLVMNQGFSYIRTHQIPVQVWSAQCLQCTVHPNLALTISVISVKLTSLLSNNVPHIINKIRVILYFIQNRDIHSRTLFNRDFCFVVLLKVPTFVVDNVPIITLLCTLLKVCYYYLPTLWLPVP